MQTIPSILFHGSRNATIKCLSSYKGSDRCPFGLSETWDARSIIEAADFSLGRQGRNALLREKGIWLLHGELSGMEQSGMCDRGIQYAVINDAAIVDCKPLNPPHAP